MAINLTLEDLYYKDKKEREEYINRQTSDKEIEINTKERIKKLHILLKDIDESEIWNCHYVAYLLQHSDDIKDYKLGHEYAAKAVKMGSNVTKWLYAVTLDRWLVSQGKKQKFGTQFKQENGEWKLCPYDENVTDEEKEEYGVPSIKEALKQFKIRNNIL